MRLNKTVGLLAGTTALTLGGFCYGNTDEANTSALSQIAELKAELAAMKAQQGEEWLTEQRAADIRGIVQDVLADAETRTSLQSSGATAGYDNGFFISSADGNFRLNMNGLVQFQWILNSTKDREDASGNAVPDTRWGFGVRRARMDFSGVFAQDWKFMLQLQYGSIQNQDPGPEVRAVDTILGTGNVNVAEAWVERDVDLGGTSFSLRGGQFKAPFMREWLVDDGDQLAVDRSLLNYYFYQGYSVGLQLGYNSDMFRAAVAYTNGLGTPADYATGSYNSSWNSNPTQYSFAGRLDFKFSGNWADFDNFNSRPGTEGGLMAGFAALYQKYNSGAVFADSPTVTGLTGDVTWNFGGASLFASFVWENIDPASGSSRNPWGFMVQGGYFLPGTDDFEIFGRYSYANADTTGGDSTKLSLITVGVNYFMSANAKFTADFGYSLNTLGELYALQGTGAGWNADTGNNDGQYAIRTQLQLTF